MSPLGSARVRSRVLRNSFLRNTWIFIYASLTRHFYYISPLSLPRSLHPQLFVVLLFNSLPTHPPHLT